jgi:hypothetical protein
LSLSFPRSVVAFLAGVALLVVTLLAAPAPAGAATIYACKKPDGTIRLVGKRTRCRRPQKKIKWNTNGRAGANGTNGANGANGTNGARGPAGAFNVVDQQGRTVGLFAGFTIFGTAAYTDSGVVLAYDNVPATNYPYTLYTALYYKLPGCGGAAYTISVGGPYPPQLPTILASPPGPGSQMYSAILSVAPESFTYESVRTSTGCADSRSAIAEAYPARENGIVPIVQEPLVLQPLS